MYYVTKSDFEYRPNVDELLEKYNTEQLKIKGRIFLGKYIFYHKEAKFLH
jgi:hypothetical protein